MEVAQIKMMQDVAVTLQNMVSVATIQFKFMSLAPNVGVKEL